MTDSVSIQDKLNLETAVIKWQDLQLFFAQGKLLVVSNDQDLVHVAAIIANNQTDELSKLIEEQKVEFATVNWVKENCQEQTELWAVVVSPYVVTQLKVDQ